MDPASRLFLMDATMRGLPVQAFHQVPGRPRHHAGEAALAGAGGRRAGPGDGRGGDGDALQSTAVLAPAALAGPRHRVGGGGRPRRPRHLHQRRNGAAESSTPPGSWVDFSFRPALPLLPFPPHGKTYVVTPVDAARRVPGLGPARPVAAGRRTGRWHRCCKGPYDYIELDLLEVTYD